MNILFIDDTEQLKKQYVGVGGVILRDDSINTLCTLFKRRKKSHGIPAEVEIKWSPSKSSWLRRNLIDENRISAYSDILDLLRAFNAKVIVAVVQRDELKQSVIEAKWKCLEFVTERFQLFLQEQEDRNGIIIADFPGSGKEEKELLQNYYQLLEKGTHYVKPKNIVMNLLTTESHLNPALQLADLVVGITTGMCTPRRGYALRYWDIVKRSLHCNQNGDVMGCGLKIFPKKIIGGIFTTLFHKVIEEREEIGQAYEEYIEEQRYLYSVLMSKDELDMHFPRP